ncbi:MAG: aminoacyl-histidine dipeptidase, partial [Ruminococcaceae bacterium]|nr:aminoacyl-histidine dipeptidase [Oscillospiraceae bacterium]
MERLKGLKPERVFYYFEKICSIPHGSGNQDAISEFCVNFAAEHSLKCVRDNANNVVIYKDGTGAGKGASPIILQGHIDMVCQKVPGSDFDFEKSGLDIYTDGDFIKAKGTTLGADNGIAVAMILA